MGTHCVPLLANLVFKGYAAEFIQRLSKAGKKNLAQKYNFTHRFIDDVLSPNNSTASELMDLIYGSELETKDTTESNTSASYLDCYLCTDNGQPVTRIYDKRDDLNFLIVNFPFLCSNIPSAPAYGVYVSQLVHFARACCNYKDFVDRGKLLTNKLFLQGYRKAKLVSTVKSSMRDILTS